MKATYLIPAVFAGLAALSACEENKTSPVPSAPAAAAPAVPPPALSDLPAPYSAANLENGKSVFAKCKNCHGLLVQEGNKVGPNLHGVFDRPTATAPKFKYSPALAAFDDEYWTPDLVNDWLANPGTFLPGNAMFFNGIGKPEDRRDVIAYLMIETRK
jgi:cytochrome c